MHKNRPPAPRLSTALPITALVLSLGLGGCAGMRLGGSGQAVLGGYAKGDKVAVLLPGAGPLAGAADAIREGLRAARGADDTGAVPAVELIDSGDPAGIGDTLARAIGAGATQAIGPVEKPAVDVLAGGPALRVPTLALNEGTRAGKPSANLYQFALSPESEAADIADKARAQGLARALMIYGTDSGGLRRAAAFRSQWKSRGGTLVGEEGLPATGLDPAKTVATLLAKGHADFVFLALDGDQALAIYPQLRQGAAEIPAIATPSVYPGNVDPARDRALAGLYFVDMPWMLGVGAEGDPLRRSAVKSSAPALGSPLGRRLYAMGIDAYRLAPRLGALAGSPGSGFPGQTGRLSIDSRGNVKRELTLARFAETGPVPAERIAPAPASATRATAPGPLARTPKPEPAR